MTASALPMVVVGGYLGAGKTSLINRLLREADGRRIMVLVNDFGDINIDAELLESKSEDTIALTNGCVCCSIGGDLFMALGDALDRRPRADLLVIEASGVADPRRVAEAAKAEPDLIYGGIVTLIDAHHFEALSRDAMVGPQVRGQAACADLLAVSKCDEIPERLRRSLGECSGSPVVCINGHEALSDIILSASPVEDFSAPPAGHGAFSRWSYRGRDAFTRERLMRMLRSPPAGAFRIKGIVNGIENEAWEVHRVGDTLDIRQCPARDETVIVVIGPAPDFDPASAERWWKEA